MFHGSSSIFAKRLCARALQPWPPKLVVSDPVVYGGTNRMRPTLKSVIQAPGQLAAALILIGGIAGILGIRLIHYTTTTKVCMLRIRLIQFTSVLITDMFSFFIFHYDQLLYVQPAFTAGRIFFLCYTSRTF
jgi:hypothetical protein